MCDKDSEQPKQEDSQYRRKQEAYQAERLGRVGFAGFATGGTTGSSYNPSLQSLIAQRESLLDGLVKVQEAIRLLQSF